jgi:hypothetical protein
MRLRITYEWDIERIDAESGDIIDHYHADKLADYPAAKLQEALERRTIEGDNGKETFHLCIVRDIGNDEQGIVERAWSYVENGKLNRTFREADGAPVCTTPARFFRELAKASVAPQ